LSPITHHLLYALAWLSFGFGHSALAGGLLKPRFGRYHRLAYNVVALCHIALVWLVGQVLLSRQGFDLPLWARLVMGGMTAAGLAVMWVAMGNYDGQRLMGLRQLREPEAPEHEPLAFQGLHRYVRHPLYLGGYLILFGLAGDEAGLATALWGGLYLAIGTYYEEKRLIGLYGQAYLDYKDRVPAFLPWKGRALPPI
jgi:protein-S-isoprenylcysteine O-methyltransferase Ste14